MLKRKIPLAVLTSMIMCFVLIFTGCQAKNYQLSTSVTPSGGGTVSPSGGPFQGKVTLVATPGQNYEFIGWAGAASGNTNPLTVTMNSDKQIVAQFKRLQSSVQITLNPPDGGTVRPPGGMYDSGSTVVFTVTPASGYRFLNWGTDASGSNNPLSMVINNGKSITANFIKQYTLAVSADPNAGTVNQKGGMYDAGTAVNLKATSVFPYAFSNWSGTDNDNTNPTTVTMNANKSVTVNFKKLTAGQPVKDSQNIWGGGNTSVAIELNQSEWVQGELWGPFFTAVIQDPNGAIVKNLGAIQDVNFTFQATIAGHYTLALVNTNVLTAASYNLTYAIYR